MVLLLSQNTSDYYVLNVTVYAVDYFWKTLIQVVKLSNVGETCKGQICGREDGCQGHRKAWQHG